MNQHPAAARHLLINRIRQNLVFQIFHGPTLLTDEMLVRINNCIKALLPVYHPNTNNLALFFEAGKIAVYGAQA